MQTMTTQKTFKARVRARAEKTGESYSAARSNLIARAAHRTSEPGETAAAAADRETEADAREAIAATRLNDEIVQRATGRPIAEWLRTLDAWGARDRTHRDIARWLVSEHSVPGWWAQSLTVGYERARGMRAMHEMRDGFSVSATRTMRASADAVTQAFTDEAQREQWLPAVPMRLRRSTAGKSARFDWVDPPSRLVVDVAPKDEGRVVVAVAHEKLPDADSAARLKAMWRERLGALMKVLEAKG